MANFLRTVLIQNRAEAADRTFQQDLPVNPLSQILFTIRGIITSADTANPLADIYNTIPSLAVRYRGQDIIRGSFLDLAVINACITHNAPFGYMPQDAAGESWSLTVAINLGRMPYNVKECFPAVRRGDLVLEATVDTVVNNVDLIDIQVETVELLDETPERYLKYTTSQNTFVSTGVEVVRLPIGNPLLSVLLFGTTTPTAALQTATWEQLRTKVDNVEALYAASNWATLHGELLRRIHGDITHLRDHAHRFNGAAAAFANTLDPIRNGSNEALEQYAYLDFDPLGDSTFMLETAGRADVTIQRDAGTADLGRFIPVELVSIGGQAGS
jgi:hypothetical protein